MDKHQLNQSLLSFLDASPTPFHAVRNIKDILQAAGFSQLFEEDQWQLSSGKFFVTRNGSSIIAFIVGKDASTDSGIRIVGAHTDSPCLKVKPKPEKKLHQYLSLGVEVYGGVLLNPWFDRDLSIAGRVTFESKNNVLMSRLINFKRAIATIPSLAIHLDREANKARSINPQQHIPPLLLINKTDTDPDFESLIKSQLQIEHKDTAVEHILGHDLCFYNTQPAAEIGLESDFIAGARLDNLLSCFVGLSALLEANEDISSILVCSDHEEVGSASAEGAEGTFLKNILERMVPEPENRQRTLANSMLISADNAHGIHPNYPDKHDGNHGPLLNSGPVIKINANQRYATNSETAAYFKAICNQHEIPCQSFVVRSDMACGSTIGPITAKEIGVKTLDIGVPTFAMHSIRELAGSDDIAYLYQALKAFYKDAGVLGASRF